MRLLPTLPIGPLLEALGPDADTVSGISHRTGLSRHLIYQALRTGYITTEAADRAIIAALNVHPTHIYGDAWLHQDSFNDPITDLRIRAQHEAWQLRHELRQDTR